MMGRGNALDRGQTKITLERVFNTSLCEIKFKSKMQSKTVLTWANCLHHGIILPYNVKSERNLLNEHQFYPYLAAMAPINVNRHQFEKLKDLLPYLDKVLMAKNQ
jgi:hypothetical protein